MKRSREPLRLLLAETESAVHAGHAIVCVAALLTPGELRLTLAGSPDAEQLLMAEAPAPIAEEDVIEEDEPFVIHPGEFCLGRTLEHVTLPDDIVARIEGKSSLGRLGLIVHATAGFCDPGWRGTLTLELNNLTRVPIKLWPRLLIAQLSFMTLDQAAERPYGHEALGSHYQGQVAATESRYGRTHDLT